LDNLESTVIAEINTLNHVMILLIGIFAGGCLGLVIKKFSRIIGDRIQYFYVFPILIPTTILIITVIKSSLALSLGLVGALSIIRFRTPVKEPEELAYIFISIALGIGLGAGQVAVSLVSFSIVISVIVLLGIYHKTSSSKGVYIDINSSSNSNLGQLSNFSDILKKHKIPHELKRYQSGNDSFSATFFMEPKNMASMDQIIMESKNNDKNINITLLNQAKSLG
jgi:hypothetical protein